VTGEGSQTSEWILSPKAVAGGTSRSGLIVFLVNLAWSYEEQEKLDPSLMSSIPSMELWWMRDQIVSMLMWPRQQWSMGSVTHSIDGVTALLAWSTLYSPLMLTGMVPTILSPLVILHRSALKDMAYSTLVIQFTDTMVTGISGVCNVSFKMIGVEDFPCGTCIARSPTPTT
jgi:hypothetical protein